MERRISIYQGREQGTGSSGNQGTLVLAQEGLNKVGGFPPLWGQPRSWREPREKGPNVK